MVQGLSHFVVVSSSICRGYWIVIVFSAVTGFISIPRSGSFAMRVTTSVMSKFVDDSLRISCLIIPRKLPSRVIVELGGMSAIFKPSPTGSIHVEGRITRGITGEDTAANR